MTDTFTARALVARIVFELGGPDEISRATRENATKLKDPKRGMSAPGVRKWLERGRIPLKRRGHLKEAIEGSHFGNATDDSLHSALAALETYRSEERSAYIERVERKEQTSHADDQQEAQNGSAV